MYVKTKQGDLPTWFKKAFAAGVRRGVIETSEIGPGPWAKSQMSMWVSRHEMAHKIFDHWGCCNERFVCEPYMDILDPTILLECKEFADLLECHFSVSTETERALVRIEFWPKPKLPDEHN